MSEAGDILDFDQIGEENIMKSGEVFSAQSEPKQKSIVKKKQGRKAKDKQNPPSLLPPLQNLPKLSREEMKNLRAMLLFEKLEQKEKKKEDGTRKKRKTNDISSPRSNSISNSNVPEEIEKSQDDDDIPEPKSDSESFEMSDKAGPAKKSEPVKISSKYFNPNFDLKGNPSILGYLFEYSKQHINRYSHKKMKPLGQNGRSADTTPSATTPILKRISQEELERLNQIQREKNLKFKEHVKTISKEDMKDLKEAFASFKTE